MYMFVCFFTIRNRLTIYFLYFTIRNILTTSCSCDEKIESTKESICSGSDC